jgi:hypothetical protein
VVIVTSQWEYRTILVRRHQETRGSTKSQPKFDWVASFGNVQWDGWDEILHKVSDQGWELLSVVIEDQSTNSVATTGRTEAYRLFCKRYIIDSPDSRPVP